MLLRCGERFYVSIGAFSKWSNSSRNFWVEINQPYSFWKTQNKLLLNYILYPGGALQRCLLPSCYWFWVFLTSCSSLFLPQLIRSWTGNLLRWSVIDLIATELNGIWHGGQIMDFYPLGVVKWKSNNFNSQDLFFIRLISVNKDNCTTKVNLGPHPDCPPLRCFLRDF